MEILTARAVDGGTYIIPITSFMDEDGAAITPVTDVTWKTYNSKGTKLGEGSVSAAAAVDLVISGDALTVSNVDGDSETVTIVIATTYNSTLGSGLPAKLIAKVEVDDDPGT